MAVEPRAVEFEPGKCKTILRNSQINFRGSHYSAREVEDTVADLVEEGFTDLAQPVPVAYRIIA